MTAIERTLFDSDHEIFRDTVRRFVEEEIAPFHAQWEKDGKISRDAWLKAGELGLLCASMPEEYGGGGVERTHSVILLEELARAGATGPGFGLHSEIVAPYINRYGSEEQKRKFLPKMAKGEMIGAIAMTEPGTGSDLQGVRTTALKDGNELVINGSKTFITNGEMSDVVIVVAKTDPEAGAKGISLVLVEAEREGFRKGRNLEKIGLKAQDTSELFFDDVRVPMTNLLGEEGKGFVYLMQELAWERLQLSISAVANTEAAVEWTIDYTKQREAFGQPIHDFQNTRFKLAEAKTQATVARTFVDKLIALMLEDKLDAETAAMAKWWTSDTQCRVIDECLQLHGGYGYMWEFPIARAWADARIQRIYAGTNEIMKEIIGRSL
ncbi:MAG: acyl-CoA dehydrogenase family protein [Alphaproteobacteria bacterium]|jgi:acyl-CoA dehydrogenase|nr:acyl-CoA dehydrogenase family protein [Alphaproteobacteria bacterium]MDP6253512.1 acyl-CoA dehydrogenase family protein [Alphaproteobacteria bacterium]MDP7055989.1 acyl-CoA dehydrogenase family protein [Alphaproteobacteria bacterium]MDP7229217.1 acyl-CoA dehydrogenase family protein [Alphaproteobacteria bacterium]MDP7460593.1 acyl-CoA dehydrogenase family protein [Alphaproteobacteria bacterium]|tara:strand:- start:3831 stop:4973 length:1143 start_codon:yes stop_codon:yes gene_type:complete